MVTIASSDFLAIIVSSSSLVTAAISCPTTSMSLSTIPIMSPSFIVFPLNVVDLTAYVTDPEIIGSKLSLICAFTISTSESWLYDIAADIPCMIVFVGMTMTFLSDISAAC